MSGKKKLNKAFFIIYVLTVIGVVLGHFMSIWFYLISVYSLLHLFFGPLDWFLLFKLYLWLKRDNEVWKD